MEIAQLIISSPPRWQAAGILVDDQHHICAASLYYTSSRYHVICQTSCYNKESFKVWHKMNRATVIPKALLVDNSSDVINNKLQRGSH